MSDSNEQELPLEIRASIHNATYNIGVERCHFCGASIDWNGEDVIGFTTELLL